MSDDQPKSTTDADAELQREIRAGRDFTLAEAIGRMAGPGMMKGVSPITRLQQAVTEIQEYLNGHLTDAAGVLQVVLLRQVEGSDLLLHDVDQPLVALAAYIQKLLDSDYSLKELVRETDVEWGRVYGERPYFEKEGKPPASDDPYTHESVRGALSELVSALATGNPNDVQEQPRG